eukprot:7325025-Ditylum_brightwellii.AAC.1
MAAGQQAKQAPTQQTQADTNKKVENKLSNQIAELKTELTGQINKITDDTKQMGERVTKLGNDLRKEMQTIIKELT